MDDGFVRMYETDIKVAVDPASGDDRCCKIWYTCDSDGSITIQKVEEWQPSVIKYPQRR